jgi:hypothetical protein
MCKRAMDRRYSSRAIVQRLGKGYGNRPRRIVLAEKCLSDSPATELSGMPRFKDGGNMLLRPVKW